jgi:hypothetical protein
MKFSEIPARMTGFSTPLFGVSWEPATSDVAVARKVLTFLEDRRVLYVEEDREIADYCVDSVLGIRRFLTGVLGEGGLADDLTDHLRAMRAAGRRFLDRLHVDPDHDDPAEIWTPTMQGRHWDPYDWSPFSWSLPQALGELRATFGIHIGQIAAKYGIDLEDDLASILPAEDE